MVIKQFMITVIAQVNVYRVIVIYKKQLKEINKIMYIVVKDLKKLLFSKILIKIKISLLLELF